MRNLSRNARSIDVPQLAVATGKPGVKRTGVMMTVDTISWFFRVDSISSTARAGRKSVASRVVSRQTRMPEAVISSG
jgi:hypothetical protein